MESTPSQVFAAVLCVTSLLAGHSSGIPVTGVGVQSVAQQFPTDSFLPSELTVSVLVNQMMLVKMLNDSSTTCSLHETAIAEANMRQEDAKEELRRSLEMALTRMEEKKEELRSSLEMALTRMEEKKEETLQDLTEKETQLATLRQAAINELTKTKHRLKEELNTTIQTAMPRKTFQLYDEKVNHSAAMDDCRRRGGYLAFPENEEEHERLLSVIKRQHTGLGNKPYWIAVDDKEEEGVWVNSHTGLPLSFTNFAARQPDNYGTHGEDCIIMVSDDGRWNDIPCSVSRSYLCEFTNAYIYT